MDEKYMIDVDNVTVRFNMASEKVDNLKEYFVKMLKHQLMFQEFWRLRMCRLRSDRARHGAWSARGVGRMMLKLISGILTPHKGSVQVNDVIAPLIELGAGFDMELTAKRHLFEWHIAGAFQKVYGRAF